jgi:RecA/RadA recombinase
VAKRQEAAAASKPSTSAAEEKALNNAIGQIEKAFGAGAIMKLGENHHMEVEGISTGALSLDLALGGKGLPRGRVVEIFGPESSGKTTLALSAVANAQQIGGVAAFIDAEHALDPAWCKKLGVNLESLLISQPSSGEEALQIAEMLVASNAVDIIVVDSVAALVPKSEIEGDIGDSFVGVQARLMSQAMRKLTPLISRSKCILIFINQIREKIGVMFGSPETTTGGPRPQILFLVPDRRPPDRPGQGRRRHHREPREGQGGQEQDRPALPRLRVRPDVQRRDLARGGPARPGPRRQARREVGLVVQLRGPAARPGAREHQAIPQGQPGDRERAVRADPRQAGDRRRGAEQFEQRRDG